MDRKVTIRLVEYVERCYRFVYANRVSHMYNLSNEEAIKAALNEEEAYGETLVMITPMERKITIIHPDDVHLVPEYEG